MDDDEEDGFLKAFKVLFMLYYSLHFYLCASSDLRYALFRFLILAFFILLLYSLSDGLTQFSLITYKKNWGVFLARRGDICLLEEVDQSIVLTARCQM